MNTFVLFMVIALVSLTTAEKYTDRFDNVNVQEILSNDALVAAYSKCMLDQGKCTPEGKEMKANVGDALENNCEKCTDKQKEMARMVIKHMINHEDAYWKELKAKYDPNNKYTTKYEKELREILA